MKKLIRKVINFCLDVLALAIAVVLIVFARAQRQQAKVSNWLNKK